MMEGHVEVCDSEVEVEDPGIYVSLPHDAQSCYNIIWRMNKNLERELEKVGPTGREGYDKDLRGWKAEAHDLGNCTPHTRKFAFIGRTGAGKSTAINAILGAPVLSTRADGSAYSPILTLNVLF
jgi:predicted GTPase